MAEESAALIREIHSELRLLIQKLESAFPKDDNGDVDYQAHRLYHKKEAEDAKQYKDSKSAIIRNILTWASIGLATIIFNSIIDGRILPFIKPLIAGTH